MRGEDVPGEQRQRGRQTPLRGEHLSDLFGGFIAAFDGIDGAERRHRDFARGHARAQRHRDLPVEAERREQRRDRLADDSGKAVVDGGSRSAGGRLRERCQEPDQHHHRKDRGAGALQEHLGAVIDADCDAAHARHLVIGQLQHEGRRRVVAPHQEFDQERHPERAGDAGGVEAEHHEPLQIDPTPDQL